MRPVRCVTLLFAALTGTLGSIAIAKAQATSFTYQGQLKQGGAVVNGLVDLTFTLYGTPIGGNPLAPPVTLTDVNVQGGLFTAPLDFGAVAASSDPRWLEISILPSGSVTPVILSPRQSFTPTLRAILADTAAGWSRTIAPSVDQVSPSTFASGGTFAPFVILQGQFIGQTFKPARNDQLSSVTLKASTVLAGISTASIVVNVQRGATVLQSVVVPITSTAPTDYVCTLPTPVPVFANEVLQFTVLAQGEQVLTRVWGVNSPDRYSRGELFGPGYPSGNPLDLEFSTSMDGGASVNTLPVQISGGALTVRNPADANSLITIDSGSVAGTGSAIDFQDRGASKFGLGKTASNDFYLDTASIGRVLTIPSGTLNVGIGTTSPSNRLSVGGSVDISARLGVGGPVSSTAALNVVGSASISGAATLGSLSTTAITSTSLSTGSVSASTISAGSIPSLTPNLAVAGPTLLDNTGNIATDVALRVRHNTNTISSWAVRIENADVAGFQGGLRLSGGGFLEATNRAASGLASGYARLDSAGNWTAISDERLKTDITPATDLLELARALRPVHYRWRNGPDDAPHLGLIAQDVDRVAPDLVAHADTLSVDYARTSVIAIGAVQQLAEQVDRLERENRLLKDRLDRLERSLRPNP